MKTPQTSRWTLATLVLAALMSGGAVLAQSAPRVVTDAAPRPAEDRASTGAIVMMDQPVLAQREMMQDNLASTRLQTSVMGNSAARVLSEAEMKALRDAGVPVAPSQPAGARPARPK